MYAVYIALTSRSRAAYCVLHGYYTHDMLLGFPPPRKSLGNLSFSDALYVTDILSAGQMMFHAHVQSAVLMQSYIGHLGCGFRVWLSFLFCMLYQL